MDILEELKKQKETEQGSNESPEAMAGQINTYQHSILLGSLKTIHDYLYELIGNLNHLDYTTTAEIQIPGLGSISNLHQNNYELLWENRPNQNQVIVKFRTQINDSCSYNLEHEINNETENLLQQAGISFSTEEGNKILDGNINSSITFLISPDENGLILKLHNVSQLGEQQHSFSEKRLNEYFFDQMGCFLLHRENNFIDILSSQSFKHTTQREEGVFDQDSGIHTQEMDVSRVRSLFNKEVQLYLTYHNTIKEINTKSGDFIIGRSKQSNIIVNSDLASRHHAKIVFRKGKYVLIDQSTNGTFVKTQGGKEVYVQGEELPLSGSGFISLGKSVTIDNEHIIYFSCQ